MLKPTKVMKEAGIRAVDAVRGLLGAEVLKERLKLTPAARGANVALHIPTDESLFEDASEPAPNVFCTSPIVTCLDLWSGSDREREAAEHLASEFFPWLR